MISIGVVGRNLNHPSWSGVFDVLNQGVDSEFWSYKKYPIDSVKNKFTGSDDQYLIFLATIPHYDNGKDFIKFSNNPDKEHVSSVMQEFIDRIFLDMDRQITEQEQEQEQEVNIPDDPVTKEDCISEIGTEDTPECIHKQITGVIISLNDKVGFLGIEDVEKLNELFSHIEKHGLKVVDIECT